MRASVYAHWALRTDSVLLEQELSKLTANAFHQESADQFHCCLRGFRRRCSGGGPVHWDRQPHRPQVSGGRPRFRGQLLPERYPQLGVSLSLFRSARSGRLLAERGDAQHLRSTVSRPVVQKLFTVTGKRLAVFGFVKSTPTTLAKHRRSVSAVICWRRPQPTSMTKVASDQIARDRTWRRCSRFQRWPIQGGS